LKDLKDVPSEEQKLLLVSNIDKALTALKVAKANKTTLSSAE